MKFFTRIIKSIVSLKKRTAIIGGLFLVISTFLITARLTQYELQNVLANVQKDLNSLVTIELDYEKILQSMYSGGLQADNDVLNEELIDKIEESSYVKDFSVSASTQLFTQYADRTPKHEDKVPGGIIEPSNEIEIYDSSDPELAKYNLQIVEGELATDTNAAYPLLVSKKYAEKHKLSIGVPLVLDFNPGYDEEQDILKKDGIITGIYELDANSPRPYKENEERLFFSTRNVLKEVKELLFSKDAPLMAGYDKIKVNLKDPMDTQKFLNELDAENSRYQQVAFKSSYEQYKTIQSMITDFSSILNFIQLFLILFALIVIGLIMILSLRERKYEVGLLLSLGETKTNILLQMFLEVAIVLIVSFGISFALSTTVIAPQASAVVNEQMQASMRELSDNNSIGMPRGENYVEDESTKLKTDISVTRASFKESLISSSIIFSLLAAITCITTILPTIKITKKVPKRSCPTTNKKVKKW